MSSARNEFSARFTGGYRLYTTVATNNRNNGAPVGNGGGGLTPVGAFLAPGQSAWQTLSDSTRKERVVPADGNRFLESIGRMRLGSWNYKGQSADSMRHYGPMAQDFYAAFGHDGVGTVGEKTTINQADFDGVNLIAIQALYRQVQELRAANAGLAQQLRQLQADPAAPRRAARAAELAGLRRQNAALQAQAAAATTEAARAQAQATTEAFEARLRALEAGGQARK